MAAAAAAVRLQLTCSSQAERGTLKCCAIQDTRLEQACVAAAAAAVRLKLR
jgi:hypothetical protein